MNITSLIKISTTSATLAAAALFSSCIQPTQQAAQTQQQSGINPYAVPGMDGQTQVNPTYTPNTTGQAPYQQLPGVPTDQPQVYTPDPTPTYTPPSAPSTPSSSASTHDVVSGESLWRISRKYGVTVDALKQANGLTNDNIWAGQKLNIPGN